MLNIIYSNKFKKSVKIIIKRNYDVNKLTDIIKLLAQQIPLADKHHDHELTGNYKGFRECHIEPDWLLIYFIEENALNLIISDTGTHSDLF